MSDLTVYLAGPITGLTYATAGSWRDYAAEQLGERGIVTLNPLRTEINWREDDVMPATFNNDRYAVACDVYDIQQCDMVLANFDGAQRVSVGSVAELGYAYAKDKFIVVVLEEGSLHDHMFVRAMASVIVPTLDEAVRVIGLTLVPEPTA